MPTSPRPACAVLLLLAAALHCAGCGGGSALPPIHAEAPVLELLARPELRRVVRQDPDRPVTEGLMKPRGAGRGDHGAYPALELAPPAEVAFDLPATFPEAVLSVALAIKAGGYKAGGAVRFVFELDGAPLFDRELPCAEDVPTEERRWQRFELPVGGGGELRVRTTYSGPAPVAPNVGLGLLRVVVPYEVERRAKRPGAPNVVLIVIDTLRGDRLGAAGNARRPSPVLDALAERGVRFERAYSAGAWTMPSTASLLTGMSPPGHGVGFRDSYYVADSILTLAEAFQREGFTTGAFTCNPLIAPARNFHQGFETFVESSWRRASDAFPEVEAWLREARDRQFFLYLHYVEPHYPYEPTPEGSRGIVGERPADYLDLELDKYLPEYYADPALPAGPLLDTRDFQLALYDAEIVDVDREVGRVLDALRALDLLDETVVAVTSDHGEEFLENGFAGHGHQLFDGTTRVPLIVAGPGVPAGRVVEPPVENRHVAPTLLALAGLEPGGNLRGTNLVAEAEVAVPDRAPVFITNTKGRRADLERRELRELGQVYSVIHEGWRLVTELRAEGEGVDLLFDLGADPDCARDVAAEHPARVEALRELVRRWIAESATDSTGWTGANAATIELMRDIGYVGEDE